MKSIGIIAVIWLSICGLTILVFHIKSHRFFKSIILNALLGFASIALINLTQKFTGVSIPVNWYTVGGSGILGLPFVFGSLLLQLLI